MLDTPTIQINFNPEWAGYIDGAVARLLHLSLWLGDDTERAAAVDEIRKFLALLQERNPGIEMTDQAANTFYAGPGSGAAAPPAFRAIVSADLTTALTTPPPIGAVTPAAARFTAVGIGAAVTSGQMIKVVNTSASDFGIHVTAHASQTAALMRLQDSSGTYSTELNFNTSFTSRLPSGSSGIVNGRVAGDADFRILLNANGSLLWGDGTNQTDLRLDRGGAGIVSVTGIVNATNTVTNTHRLITNSSGTPAAGFGSALLTALESSTTNNRSASIIKTIWNVATDAGAIADLVLSAYYNAAGTLTEREGFRVRGGASAVQWSIGGATPGATETVTGSRGGNEALADLLTKLASKGIIVDGSS